MHSKEVIFKRHFKMAKSWISRRCFVCGKKSGWGKKNVDAIWVHGFQMGYFMDHFHPHCLKDAICFPENYENKVVERAVIIYKMWEELLLKERMEILKKKTELEELQQEICKGG